MNWYICITPVYQSKVGVVVKYGLLRCDTFIFPPHRAVCIQPASLRQDQTAWNVALMFLYWCCCIQYQSTGRPSDCVDIYEQSVTHRSLLWRVNKRHHSCPSYSLYVSSFLISFCPSSLHSLPSPSEADLTDWRAFPRADMKRLLQPSHAQFYI